jgi:hypothetical protein
MSRSGEWATLPETVNNVLLLEAHYKVLGCTPGSARLDGLIGDVCGTYGSESLTKQFRNAAAMFAEDSSNPRAIAALARVTWVTF